MVAGGYTIDSGLLGIANPTSKQVPTLIAYFGTGLNTILWSKYVDFVNSAAFNSVVIATDGSLVYAHSLHTTIVIFDGVTGTLVFSAFYTSQLIYPDLKMAIMAGGSTPVIYV